MKFSGTLSWIGTAIWGQEYTKQVKIEEAKLRDNQFGKRLEESFPYIPPSYEKKIEPRVTFDVEYESEPGPGRRKKKAKVAKVQRTAEEYHADQTRGTRRYPEFEKFNQHVGKEAPILQDEEEYMRFMMRYVSLYGSRMASQGIIDSEGFDANAYEYMYTVKCITDWIVGTNSHLTRQATEWVLRLFLQAMKAYVISNYGGHTTQPRGFLRINEQVRYKPFLKLLPENSTNRSAEYWHERWTTQVPDQARQDAILAQAYADIPYTTKRPRLNYVFPANNFDLDKKDKPKIKTGPQRPTWKIS